MPEAAVDEDGEFFADEGYVGADGSSAGCGVGSAELRTPVATAPGTDKWGHHSRDGLALGCGRSFVAEVHKKQFRMQSAECKIAEVGSRAGALGRIRTHPDEIGVVR